MRGAESRVTVDIDPKGGWTIRALRAYYALERAATQVDVRISSSGNGIHIIGWFTERLSDEQKERMRRNLGDDHNRVHLDTVRNRVGHMTQVLWTGKGDTRDAVDEDFDDIHDAIDFASM